MFRPDNGLIQTLKTNKILQKEVQIKGMWSFMRPGFSQGGSSSGSVPLSSRKAANKPTINIICQLNKFGKMTKKKKTWGDGERSSFAVAVHTLPNSSKENIKPE